MGVEAGSGETWVAPLPRENTAPKPVAVAVAQATPVDPAGIPPHLPAPQPQPSPGHQQIHLSHQEWKGLIKGRWDDSDEAKNKKFLKQYRQTEFHVNGDSMIYQVDKKGKMVAVYDAQKSYNITGAKNGYPHIPLTLNGQPTYAGTSHMYPVTSNRQSKERGGNSNGRQSSGRLPFGK
jgi:hypothetical protein